MVDVGCVGGDQSINQTVSLICIVVERNLIFQLNTVNYGVSEAASNAPLSNFAEADFLNDNLRDFLN